MANVAGFRYHKPELNIITSVRKRVIACLLVTFPTSCAIIKIIAEEEERYGRAARTSHLAAGTKMTPVAERWPELDFAHCRVGSPWLLVPLLDPSRDCAVKSPTGHKGSCGLEARSSGT